MKSISLPICFIAIAVLLTLISCNKDKNDPIIEPEQIIQIQFGKEKIKSGETVTLFGNFEKLLKENPKNITFDFFAWMWLSDRREKIPFPVTIEIQEITKSQITLIANFNINNKEIAVVDMLVNGKRDPQYASTTIELQGILPAVKFSFGPWKARIGEVIILASSEFMEAAKDEVKIRFTGSDEWVTAFHVEAFKEYLVGRAYFKIPKGIQPGDIELNLDGHVISKSQNPLTIVPSFPALKQGYWGQRANFGAGENYSVVLEEYLKQGSIGESRSGASSFVANNTAYIVGGAGFEAFGGNPDSKKLWEYDVDFDIWLPKADFPAGSLSHAVAFVIDGKAYVGTGFSNEQESNTFYCYDPKLNTWEKKANFPGDKRAFAVGFSANGIGYIGAGSNNDQYFNDFYAYHAQTDTWTKKANVPGERTEAYSFSLDGKGYVGGGRLGRLKYYDLYQYDASKDTWIQKKGIPSYEYTSGNVAVTTGSEAYVGLGYDRDKSPQFYSTNEIYKYTPGSDTWSKFINYADETSNSFRSQSTGFFLDNTLFIGLGQAIGNSQRYSSFWGYKLSNGQN
ncbi:Kelch repeat-containing protein [Sphingobacterium faecale]|uniref:Kelch motif protein n=1 Tax=Sphingobacterium faecale TaxID=2803775 RepID=A0ABS1R8R3_9SPHI|nr:kelch repeat-containing protein [Sphingobacterium faecale]MBL1411063.1 hypothetical protein [Sphingobacterium faecale]